MNNYFENASLQQRPQRWEEIISWGLIGYFAVKVFYFAFRIKERIFPDESSWLGISQVFSRSILPPIDSPESYSLGLITHIPNLYFFLMGKLLTLNIFDVSDLIFLRTINAFMGVVTVVFAWKLVLRLSLIPVVRLVFLVMLTNTIMYTFTFGAINYDNMTNLFAVLSLYYMVCFFQERQAKDVVLFLLFFLAGALTKITFLPYGVAVAVVFVFSERKNLLKLPVHVCGFIKTASFQMKCIAFFCLILVGFNVNLYAKNYLKFNTFYPVIRHVLPFESSQNYRLFTRDYATSEFKAGRLKYLDAQRLILRIREPGDRASAWTMLKHVLDEKDKGTTPRVGRLDYSFQWLEMVFHRTYSVAAHWTLPKDNTLMYPYYAVFMLAAVITLLRPGIFFKGVMGHLLFIVSLFILILQQKVNYSSYSQSGLVGMSLTGRYLFPVIIPLYILVAQGLFVKMPKWWQVGLGVVVAVCFVGGEFPWFVQNVTPNWYF